MKNDAFLNGKEIITKIEQANEKAYFVGGSVRDLILNRPIKDIDIATSASPDRIQQIFPKVIPVGIEHGTVIVRYKGESYEVTTFRVDGEYSNHRHPDEVQFIQTIDEDLKRRDFTINALAMDKEGKIIDLFNGIKDIENQTIRTVGDGFKRFSEDALRMIRAIRFSSQLGFNIEDNTLKNIILLKENIESVAIERITNEITKLFSGKYIEKGICYLEKTKIYKHLPIFKEHPSMIHRFPKYVQPLHSFGEVIVLLHSIEPMISIRNWVREWKCSKEIEREANELKKALAYYMENGLDKWLVYKLQSKYYEGFVRLVNILYNERPINMTALKNIKNNLMIHSKQDLAIKGNDILHIYPNIKKGPWIHNMILEIEKNVVFNHLKNNKEHIKEWIKCNPPKID